MLDIAAIRAAFPDLANLTPLTSSGQRDVFRGQRSGSEIVLKIVRAIDAQAEARILREVEAVAQLNSSYVPRITDYGRRPIGAENPLFIVEEYVRGKTYRDRLQAEPVQPLSQVLRVAEALLRACVEFEAARLVHRDIKPENIIIGPSGEVWIIDFGIVRMLDRESITPTGPRWGSFTPGYGAPEQMRNLKPRIDARTDLFSVGIVLYESIAGQNPYVAGAADQLEIMRRVDNQDLPLLTVPGDVASELSVFIGSLVSRFPSRRPQMAADALKWFEGIRPRLTTGP